MLDHQIKLAAEHFGIRTPEDWCEVRPEWIRQVHGCGPATVDHLRLYLAARGLTLKDDATPDYWQQNLAAARIGTTIAKTDIAVTLPFTICVDTHEQQPFEFQGHRADSDLDNRPLLIPLKYVELGATHGDYAIDGLNDCFIERKGLSDAIGTFLAHPGSEKRDRWEATLEFLASVQTAAIVIEATFLAVIGNIQSRGQRSKSTLQKTLHRQVLAWEQDYRVPFIFCDTRRFAEQTTLSLMRRHWRKRHEKTTTQEAQDLATALIDF